MAEEIEFYYDFASPNAYLVEAVLPGLAARHGVSIRRVPVLVGGIFKTVGNVPPLVRFQDLPAKTDYLRLELDRFVARHKVPFRWTPTFPILSTPLMRAAIFAQGKDWEVRFRETIYRHCWVEAADMNDPAVIFDVLRNGGFPAQEIAAAIQTDAIKSALFQTTAEAVARGVFGVPTLFFRGEMYFGKDSLIDLEWALRAARS